MNTEAAAKRTSLEETPSQTHSTKTVVAGKSWCCCNKVNSKSIALAALWLLVGVAVVVALVHFKNYQTAAIGGAAWAGLTLAALLGRCCWKKCHKCTVTDILKVVSPETVHPRAVPVVESSATIAANQQARQLLHEAEENIKDEVEYLDKCEQVIDLKDASLLLKVQAREKIVDFLSAKLPASGRLVTEEQFADAYAYFNAYMARESLLNQFIMNSGWEKGLSEADRDEWTRLKLAQHNIIYLSDLINQFTAQAEGGNPYVAAQLGIIYARAYCEKLTYLFVDNEKAREPDQLKDAALKWLFKCAGQLFLDPTKQKVDLKFATQITRILKYLRSKIADTEPQKAKQIDQAIVGIKLPDIKFPPIPDNEQAEEDQLQYLNIKHIQTEAQRSLDALAK